MWITVGTEFSFSGKWYITTLLEFLIGKLIKNDKKIRLKIIRL